MVVGLIASIIQIVLAVRQVSSRTWQIVSVTLFLITILLAVDAARTRGELEVRENLQSQAQALIDRFGGPDGVYESYQQTAGDNEGVALAAMNLLEGFSECRPSTLKELRTTIESARKRAEEARATMDEYDVSDAGEDAWEDAGDSAYALVAGIADSTPACQRAK